MSSPNLIPIRHDVALWAGVAAFFGSLLAVGIFDLTNAAKWIEYCGAVLVAGITAGGVYATERLNDAKRAKGLTDGNPQTPK